MSATSDKFAYGGYMKLKTQLMPMLGTLEVYCYQTIEEQMLGIATSEIYWRDAGSPQGYGPFPTVYDALNHYKWVIRTCEGEPVVDENGELRCANKIIRIDFFNKKRVNNPDFK